ncbi:MAG TPA: DUF5687 family protein, partial [Bacteroidota bacterium]|nr:DUF5687 family protein [Bacteroidota bacterium]
MITGKDFLVNEWRSILRSPMAGQTIWLKILWGVLMTIVLLQVMGAGYFFPEILRKESPGSDPVTIVNRMLWGYFFADALIRIVMTTIPATVIQQYLHCNIGRGTIARYLIVKSFINPVNAIGLGLWGMFTVSNSGVAGAGLLWLCGIIFVLCINTMLVLYAATFARMAFTLAVVGVTLAIVGALEYLHLPILREAVTAFFAALSSGNPLPLAIPAIALGVLGTIVFQKIKSLMYLDRMTVSGTTVTIDNSAIAHIPGWRFEWLVVYRNKRLKTMMIMMYGFFGPNLVLQMLNVNRHSDGAGGAILPYLFLSLYFFMFSGIWAQLSCMAESTFFDRLAALPGTWSKFFRRKYAIAVAMTTFGAILIAVADAFFFESRYAVNILALYLFSCGSSIFLILLRTTFHRQRFEIATSAWFNYQGQSFSFMDIAIMLYAFFPPALFIGLKIFDRVWYLNPILMLIGGTG